MQYHFPSRSKKGKNITCMYVPMQRHSSWHVTSPTIPVVRAVNSSPNLSPTWPTQLLAACSPWVSRETGSQWRYPPVIISAPSRFFLVPFCSELFFCMQNVRFFESNMLLSGLLICSTSQKSHWAKKRWRDLVRTHLALISEDPLKKMPILRVPRKIDDVSPIKFPGF